MYGGGDKPLFVVLMLMREAAIAYGDRWRGLPIARMHWTSLAVMAGLAAAAVLWMAGYW